MHEGVIRTPIPQSHYDVAFHSGGTRRHNLRRFPCLDRIGPFGNHLQSEGAIQAGRRTAHTVAANTGLQAVIPSFDGSFEFWLRCEYMGQIPRDSISDLMAEIAARFKGVHPAFESLLR